MKTVNTITFFMNKIKKKINENLEVLPRFELGSPDSESGVLTITP